MEGGLWGLLVGDAVGVPYEFHPPGAIPPVEQIELDPPAGFSRAHAGVPPGTWSDDGAHALCLLASLCDREALDQADLMRRLVSWQDTGYLAVDGRVFDVGIQTSYALERNRKGVAAHQCGGKGERENGNGSLMRVLPLALWHTGADDELVNAACAQSVLTHAHLRSQMACALYCLWARRLLEGVEDAWEAAVQGLRAMVPDGHTARAELDRHLATPDRISGRGSGYVADSLRSARDVLEKGPYEVAVKEAIRLGHDTDTTACIAGGLAGVRDGVGAIPARWLDRLRGKELVEPLLARLLARVRSHPGATS